MSSGTAAGNKTFVGVLLEVNGKEVPLIPKNAIGEIKTKGIDVGLEENLRRPAKERLS